MHKMTHQKVRAEEKWGAIPMIPETSTTFTKSSPIVILKEKKTFLKSSKDEKAGTSPELTKITTIFAPSKAVRSAKGMELCLKMKKQNLSKITLNKKVQAPV
ncbi:DUF6241 domain-containing protein [Siminovitchia terrae]